METACMDTRRTELCGGSRGFTLVELLIAMMISGLVFGAIFSVYQFQQKHYTAQLDVIEMQQNIRAALNLISRDIRMAGFEAAGASAAGIMPPDPDTNKNLIRHDLFYLTVDLNEDGDTEDPGENISYDQYISPTTDRPVLGRTSSDKVIKFAEDPDRAGIWIVKPEDPTDPVHQPAAENIEHLHFYYLDEDGASTTSLTNAKTVLITVVARASNPDPNFSNTQTYTAADGVTTWVKNDNYRRKMQILTVECRNAGI